MIRSDPWCADTVILVHGLWMPGLVLRPYQYWIEKEGFFVRRFSYPSWSQALERNADLLDRFVADTPGRRLHLICHSLGGLVTLSMLERHWDQRIQRLVLMGTPVADCHCGRYLARRRTLAPLLGKSMSDWLARAKPAVPTGIEIGILAGTRRLGLGCVIPGLQRPNDGVVAVAETRLPDATDELILPVSHSGMLLSPSCAQQAAHFLRAGRFSHDS
ncbi:MAG: lipase family alpha/beta hydrolase [Actinomycetota bacterium]